MSSSNMVAVLWGSDLGKGIIDGAAVPCCSWCFEGILKPFHHDLRSRLLGGETAEWIGAATGVLGGFEAFARCCCCDAGWDGGVGAADVMIATARWRGGRDGTALGSVLLFRRRQVQGFRIGSGAAWMDAEVRWSVSRGEARGDPLGDMPEDMRWVRAVVVGGDCRSATRCSASQAGARFSATGAGSGRPRGGVLESRCLGCLWVAAQELKSTLGRVDGVVGAGPAEFGRLFSDETTTCLAVAGWLSQVK
jgi:hypothetical protein